MKYEQSYVIVSFECSIISILDLCVIGVYSQTNIQREKFMGRIINLLISI